MRAAALFLLLLSPLLREAAAQPLTRPSSAGAACAATLTVAEKKAQRAALFRSLIARWRKTQDAATYREIRKNIIGLTMKLANRNHSLFRSISVDDYLIAGFEGMATALERYDEDKGSFSTYAAYWMNAKMRAMRESTMRAQGLPNIYIHDYTFFLLLRHADPSIPEDLKLLTDASVKFRIPISEVMDIARTPHGASSALEHVPSGTPASDDLLVEKDDILRLRQVIARLIPDLNDREQAVLQERLLADEPLGLQELADRFKVTNSAIFKTESNLKRKIGEAMRALDSPGGSGA